MSSNFSVYCINKVTEPPVSLTRRQNGAFYCHIAVPIPDQLVVFCEGDWSDSQEYQVTLTYKDDEIQLGHVTKSSSCLMWKQDDKMIIPESMSSDTEKGLAKLVLENSEGASQTDKMTESVEQCKSVLDEKFEVSTNTPERSGKSKRRNSLNKADKSPNGPSAKKQKTDSIKSTRVRTPKPDQKGNQSGKTNSPKVEKVKPNNKSPETQKGTSPTMERAGRKKKPTDETSVDKTIKTENKTDDSSKEVKEKKGKKDTKVNETEMRRGRKNSKKEDEANSPVVKSDKTLRSVSDGKPKRGKKDKLKSESSDNTENESVTKDTEKVDKENIQIDSNVISEQINTGSGLKELQIEEIKNKLLMTNSTQRIATCKDLTTRADKPDTRWGHSFCFVNKNLSVLIGGQGEKQQLCKDGVWSLDNETRRWKNVSVQTESQKPEYRMGHTATYDPLVRCIYVFGGSKNTRWFHDVHMLDLDEWKWQLVKVNGKAPTRAYHSATLYRHELWIFGGVYPRPDPQPDGCSNDIHIFSPVMESWYAPIVKGEKPIPRSGHSATLIEDQLVVYGGWDAPISYSDLHVLDMSIVEWTQPNITGTPPSPRSWHASCALSGKRLLIHGGYNGDFALEDTHIFNLDKLQWTQICVENQPSARVGHKAVCMPYRHDNEDEDEVIIFGGGDNDGAYFNDLHSLYIPFDPATIV